MRALVLAALAALAVLLAVACAPAAALAAVRDAPRRALHFGGIIRSPSPSPSPSPSDDSGSDDSDDGGEDGDDGDDDGATTYGNYTIYRPFFRVMDSNRVGSGSFDESGVFNGDDNNGGPASTIAGFGADFNSAAWGFPGMGEVLWAVPDDDTRYAVGVMNNGAKIFAVCETPESQDDGDDGSVEVNRMFYATQDNRIWEGAIPSDTSGLTNGQFSFPFGNQITDGDLGSAHAIRRLVVSPDCRVRTSHGRGAAHSLARPEARHRPDEPARTLARTQYLHIGTDRQIYVWDLTEEKWHIRLEFGSGAYVGLTYYPFDYSQPVTMNDRGLVLPGGQLVFYEFSLGGAKGDLRHYNTLTTVGNSLVFAVKDSSDRFNPVYVATPGDRNETLSDETDGVVEHGWVRGGPPAIDATSPRGGGGADLRDRARSRLRRTDHRALHRQVQGRHGPQRGQCPDDRARVARHGLPRAVLDVPNARPVVRRHPRAQRHREQRPELLLQVRGHASDPRVHGGGPELVSWLGTLTH